MVLSEGLGGEKIKSPCLRVFEPGSQDRQVVAERLAAGSAGGQDNVLPGPGGFPGLGLVAVEREDAAPGQRLCQNGRQVRREGMQVGRARRSGLPGGQVGGGQRVRAPVGEQAIQRHANHYTHVHAAFGLLTRARIRI